ncbi:inverted formin-2-like isoform X2 [Asterias rubens]|uniref:inverted formin-2-like isoform X2 n=1 Tax=Asterias rubens TaxID=7604 RepID=UPI001455A936|nr:inverted formin-2-like isoform X2 [Asterias rubens]
MFKKLAQRVSKANRPEELDLLDHGGNLENSEPELCIRLLQLPTLHNYTGLKKRIMNGDREWLQRFLELDGLDVLLESVVRLSSRGMNLAYAYLQIEVVNCIKAVMNSKAGLEYICENEEYTRKLAESLDTNNTLVKKAVFELLSALCLYNDLGHTLAIDALENYKVSKNQRYRFSLIINELRNAEIIPYKICLLSFINCIIMSTEEFEARVRLRNEFIGLQLLDILSQFRQDDYDDGDLTIQLNVFDEKKLEDDEEIQTYFPDDGVDLNSPMDVFDAIFKKVSSTPNSAPLLSLLHTLLQFEPDDPSSDILWDMSDNLVGQLLVLDQPEDVKEILKCGLSEVVKLVRRKDMNAALPVVKVEKKVAMVHVEVQTDEQEVLVKPGHHIGSTVKEAVVMQREMGNGDGTSVDTGMSGGIGAPPPPPLPPLLSGAGSVPPPPPLPGMSGAPPPPPLPGMGGAPPPPPPLPGMGGAPPPPPLPGMGGAPPPPPLPGMGGAPPPPPLPGMGGVPPPPPLPGMGGAPPPPPLPGMGGAPPPPPLPGMGGAPAPPPLPGMGGPPPPPPPGGFVRAASLPVQYGTPPPTAPKPKVKLKILNWSKIPQNRVMTPPNVSGVRRSMSLPKKNIWRCISENPEQQSVLSPEYQTIEDLFSQKTKKAPDANQPKAKKKEPTEINLLDGKRSLNVNIFLKQFRMPNDKIIELIQKGDPQEFGGAERLKGLMRVIPEKDEIEMLKNFDGDKAKLGSAETFYLLLSSIPNYQLRIEGMLLKEEFTANVAYLKPALATLQKASNDILNSKTLEEFLTLILLTGNFMNSGGFAGNAAGFKIASLMKLIDTKANKPRMNLMHYIVDVAEQKNKTMLSFPSEMKYLNEASRLSVDYLTGEINMLNRSLDKMQKQQKKAVKQVQEQLQSFLEDAKKQVEDLKEDLETINKLAEELAIYFVEDISKFKLDEFLQIFKTFAERIKSSLEENEKRRILEKKTEQRRIQKEEAEKKRAAGGGSGRKVGAPPPIEEDGCIVDNLLKDIRKGFTLKKTQSASDNDPSSPGIDPKRRSRLSRRSRTSTKRSENGLSPKVSNANSDSTTTSDNQPPSHTTNSSCSDDVFSNPTPEELCAATEKVKIDRLSNGVTHVLNGDLSEGEKKEATRVENKKIEVPNTASAPEQLSEVSEKPPETAILPSPVNQEQTFAEPCTEVKAIEALEDVAQSVPQENGDTLAQTLSTQFKAEVKASRDNPALEDVAQIVPQENCVTIAQTLNTQDVTTEDIPRVPQETARDISRVPQRPVQQPLQEQTAPLEEAVSFSKGHQQNLETDHQLKKASSMAAEVQLEEVAISMQDDITMQDQVPVSLPETVEEDFTMPLQLSQVNGGQSIQKPSHPSLINGEVQKPSELRYASAQVGSLEQAEEHELMVDLSPMEEIERPRSEVFQLSPWQASMTARARYAKPENLHSGSSEVVSVDFAAAESFTPVQQSGAINPSDMQGKVETFKPEIKVSPKKSYPAKLLTKSGNPGSPTKQCYVTEDVWEVLQAPEESQANPTNAFSSDPTPNPPESTPSQVNSDTIVQNQDKARTVVQAEDSKTETPKLAPKGVPTFSAGSESIKPVQSPHQPTPSPHPHQQVLPGHHEQSRPNPTPDIAHKGSPIPDATKPTKGREVKKSKSFFKWRKPKEHKHPAAGPDWMDLAVVDEQSNPDHKLKDNLKATPELSKQVSMKEPPKEKSKKSYFWKRKKKEKQDK